MEQTMKKLAQAIRRHTRRVMASALAACLVLAMLPMEARAAYGTPGLTVVPPTVPRPGESWLPGAIYANGMAITLEQGTYSSDTRIKNSAGNYLEVTGANGSAEEGYSLSEYIIYGGCESDTCESASVTMTGGTVHGIYGGGGGYNAKVTGNTSVVISGGTVDGNVVCGGGTASVDGSATVQISGDANIRCSVYGSSDQSSGKVGGGSSVSISGGTFSNGSVYGGGNGQVTGKSTVSITGGTISGSVYGGGSGGATEGSSVSISGNAKVGRGVSGVVLNSRYSAWGVDQFTVIGLEADAKININPEYGYDPFKDGAHPTSVAVIGVSEDDFEKFSLVGGGAKYLEPYYHLDGEEGQIRIRYAMPTVDNQIIYANGAALLIGGTGDTSTVYMDLNRDGVLDERERDYTSLATVDFDKKITDAPSDSADLSPYTICGGSKGTAITADPKITMEGGLVAMLYGGGYGSGSDVTGDASIFVHGGTVDTIYGGGDNSAISRNTAVTIDGGKVNILYGGGYTGSVKNTAVTVSGGTVNSLWGGGAYGEVTGNASVKINGGTVSLDVYGGGSGENSAVGGTKSVTVGGSAKIGAAEGEDSYGVTINGGSGGTAVTNGVNSFKIDPSLTDNASVDVVLPAGYATGTIATGAVQADLAKIHLTGNGATGKTAAFENNTIVVKLSTTPPTGDAPTITTTSLPDGTVGTAYSQALAATSGTAITWSVASGSLPAGLSLNGSTGVISGTPTAAGTSSFTVKAENSAGSATKALSITIYKPHYSISGSVMDSYAANLSGTVQLVQWGRVLQTVALGSTPCAFTFSGVAPGIYTLVATNTKGGTGSTCMTDTRQVTVANRDVTDVAMGWDHGFYVSSEVEVKGGTPPVSVGGLEQVAALIPNTQGSTAYTVKLTVEAVDAPADKAEIDAHAAGKAMDLYLDLSLLLLKDDSVIENLADAKGKVLGITVPYDFTDKQDVTVYRKHGSEAAQALMQNDSGDDGTFSLDRENGCIHIYASKFSTYAVGYIPVVTPPVSNPSHSSSGSGASSSTITATAGTGGSISPSGKVRVSRNSSKSFTIKPADGYVVDDVLVDGKSVGAVERYTFEKVTKAHTIAASFREETGKAAWNPFTDVRESDWFYDSVKYAYGRSLMLGTSPSAFSPEASTERGMIVTVLWRMEGQPEAAGIHAFTDVGSGAYYADAVAWADGNGIVLGYGDGKFGPEDTITREQLAAILWRYAQYKGKDVGAGGTLERFTDAAAVSGYAQEAMRWATGQGILSGKGDGILDPMGQATRAETAAMLMRYLQGGS